MVDDETCKLCEGEGALSEHRGDGPGVRVTCLACDGSGKSSYSLKLAAYIDEKRRDWKTRCDSTKKERERSQ